MGQPILHLSPKCELDLDFLENIKFLEILYYQYQEESESERILNLRVLEEWIIILCLNCDSDKTKERRNGITQQLQKQVIHQKQTAPFSESPTTLLLEKEPSQDEMPRQ